MTVDRKTYRDAMARLGAAVNVITTNGRTGRHGFTASAVCSVTDDPPTLLVCMRREGELNETFKENGVLCVNTLAATQEEMSGIFASSKTEMEPRFNTGGWGTLVTGAPVLEGSVVSFDCKIVQVTEVGTHSVLFCEVQAIQTGDGVHGLMYFARAYHAVGPSAA